MTFLVTTVQYAPLSVWLLTKEGGSMSLANFCLSLNNKTRLLEPKTRTGSRVWRFGGQILSDVQVDQKDKPEWYIQYERIVSQCYSSRGVGAILAPEWHKASTFKAWWDHTKDPDEDHVVTWNIVKRSDVIEFSPDTGYFFPEEVRKFFMPQIVRQTELGWRGMLGVARRFHMNNGYSARGARINGRVTLTYHATELEAHLKWLSVKISELESLIAKETRPVAREILEARKLPLVKALRNKEEVKFL